ALRALGLVSLERVGVHEFPARHAEAPRGALLDRAAAQIAVRVALEAPRVLAALARVAAAADAVHRDRERLVRVERDRAVGHRSGAEALHELRRRLDLLERHGSLALAQAQQAAQRAQALGRVVGGAGELLEGRGALLAPRVLELRHGVGVERVALAAPPPLVEPARIELRIDVAAAGEGARVAHARLAREHVVAHAGDARRGAGEAAQD